VCEFRQVEGLNALIMVLIQQTDGKMRVTFARCSSAGWCAENICYPNFCRSESIKLERGSARSLIKTFDVKKREYFGNTSMEAEISLVMANQTLVKSRFISQTFFPLIVDRNDRPRQES
jgi:hypothetical protein